MRAWGLDRCFTLRAIADNVCKNYSIMGELLDIEPFKDEMYYLWQGDSVHDKPFFRVVSTVEMERPTYPVDASES